MQTAGMLVMTGMGGGDVLGGAVGAAISAGSAKALNQLAGAIADADPTGNADMNAALGNIVASSLAGAVGAVVGGNSGAFAGTNVDRYNRQLEPEEKALAKELADQSGGRYTQAQFEDQMRQTDMTKDGQTYIGSPDTLIGDQQPSDAGARWTFAGQTADGKPILTQATVTNDPDLQRYIVNAVNGSDVPSTISYTAAPAQPKTGPQGYVIKPAAGNYCATAECAVGLSPTGIIFYPPKDQIADAASSVSTAAGRFSAVTAAAAAIPSPYAPGFATAAFVSTVAGITADAISQMVKPNVGQYTYEGILTLGSQVAGDRFPLASPAINETAETMKSTPFSTNTQDWINHQWYSIINLGGRNK